MIYSITPNPVLDLSGVVDRIIPNEKVYVHGERRSAGGNALNAGRLMKRLGVPVVVSGFLGGGVGAEVAGLLDEESVPHRFIPIAGNTRINITVSEGEKHLQTRLSFPGPKISVGEKRRLFELVERMPKRSLLVVGGSLPQGVSGRDIGRLVNSASKRGIPSVVDMPGEILREVLAISKPLMIKPNLLEFQGLTGSRVSSARDVARAAAALSRRVALICVSSVEGGAMLVTPDAAWMGITPKIQPRSTVGAGDSMVGAMCALLWKKETHGARTSEAIALAPELLRNGLASACATLCSPGLRLGNPAQIRYYRPKIAIERLPAAR